MTLGYQRASGHDVDDEIIINEKARAMDVTGRDGLELPWFELELNIFKQGMYPDVDQWFSPNAAVLESYGEGEVLCLPSERGSAHV
jgi:hypothetical protein